MITGRRRYSAGSSPAIRSLVFRPVATLQLRRPSRRLLQTCHLATTQPSSGVQTTPPELPWWKRRILVPDTKFNNKHIGSRRSVQTDTDVMIRGFIVTGTNRVIVDAVGPCLLNSRGDNVIAARRPTKLSSLSRITLEKIFRPRRGDGDGQGLSLKRTVKLSSYSLIQTGVLSRSPRAAASPSIPCAPSERVKLRT